MPVSGDSQGQALAIVLVTTSAAGKGHWEGSCLRSTLIPAGFFSFLGPKSRQLSYAETCAQPQHPEQC